MICARAEPGEEVGTILQKFGKKAAAADDDKPIFIRTLKDLAVHDGDKVTLQVEVTGKRLYCITEWSTTFVSRRRHVAMKREASTLIKRVVARQSTPLMSAN